jgi:hypothetical protein
MQRKLVEMHVSTVILTVLEAINIPCAGCMTQFVLIGYMLFIFLTFVISLHCRHSCFIPTLDLHPDIRYLSFFMRFLQRNALVLDHSHFTIHNTHGL